MCEQTADSERSNLEVVLADATARGYAAVPCRACTSDFGFPQRRFRVFRSGSMEAQPPTQSQNREQIARAFISDFPRSAGHDEDLKPDLASSSTS